MICPKCGNEVEEGKLYCEKCGEEIRIVPDFIPEIEISIEESLSNIADEVSPNDNSELGLTQELFGNRKIVLSKRGIVYLIGIILVVVCMIISLAVMIYHDNSPKYQLRLGDEQFDKGNYKQALNYYEKSVEINPEEITYRTRLADCYLAMENTEMAVEVYKDMIVYYPDNTLAYAQIIAMYEKTGEYDKIADFLEHYANDTIRENFVDYMATEPQFSDEAGDYDEAFSLSLTNPSSGKIYYTIDGNAPNEDSLVYSAPIYMGRGEHIIQAFFMNDYGVCSTIVTKTYSIEADVPDEPIVLLESGDYDIPQLIKVIVPDDCTVHYTFDGTDPDQYSRIYSVAMPLPEGITEYRFVAINSKGVMSDYVIKNYSLVVTTNITKDQARDKLLDKLVEVGYLTDREGHLKDYPGTLSYLVTDVRYVSGEIVYCFKEYYVGSSTSRSLTVIDYAVDAMTGNVYILNTLENDNYSLTAL